MRGRTEEQMYGTVFHFRAKPGHEQELEKIFSSTDKAEVDRLRKAGMQASYLFKLDEGGYMGVAVFQDQAKYRANAADPSQDAWYRQFREHLEADPEWHDGEVQQFG
jgi:hypothetical protein